LAFEKQKSNEIFNTEFIIITHWHYVKANEKENVQLGKERRKTR